MNIHSLLQAVYGDALKQEIKLTLLDTNTSVFHYCSNFFLNDRGVCDYMLEELRLGEFIQTLCCRDNRDALFGILTPEYDRKIDSDLPNFSSTA